MTAVTRKQSKSHNNAFFSLSKFNRVLKPIDITKQTQAHIDSASKSTTY